MMSLAGFCAVCICGGIGAVCRFALDGAVRRLWKRSFPRQLLLSMPLLLLLSGLLPVLLRILGCTALSPSVDPAAARMIIAKGFLGGFSTFSTAVNETVSLHAVKNTAHV